MESSFFANYWNKELPTYLNNIEVKHILGAPYHPQRYEAFKTFNKTIQRALSKVYSNTKKDENKKFDFE